MHTKHSRHTYCVQARLNNSRGEIACDIPFIRVCCTFIGKDISNGVFLIFLIVAEGSSFSGDGLRNKSNRKKETFHPSRHPVIGYLLIVIFDGIANFTNSNSPNIASHFALKTKNTTSHLVDELQYSLYRPIRFEECKSLWN